jgi:hypothetical protein
MGVKERIRRITSIEFGKKTFIALAVAAVVVGTLVANLITLIIHMALGV